MNIHHMLEVRFSQWYCWRFKSSGLFCHDEC